MIYGVINNRTPVCVLSDSYGTFLVRVTGTAVTATNFCFSSFHKVLHYQSSPRTSVALLFCILVLYYSSYSKVQSYADGVLLLLLYQQK